MTKKKKLFLFNFCGATYNFYFMHKIPNPLNPELHSIDLEMEYVRNFQGYRGVSEEP